MSEPETRVQAFTQRMAEQRLAGEEHEQRVARTAFEHPVPDVDDPLRTFALAQRAGRYRRRVKGRMPR